MQTISKKTLTDIMRYNGITVFTYTIHYPHFTTTCSSTSAQSINEFYEFRSRQAENYCRTVLYPQAVDKAMFVQKNQFPFNSHEFLSVYRITYNNDCTTSLFTDQYSYLGGAHGTTTRDSQTWDFCTGKQLGLIDFFPGNPQFTDYIFKGIQQQIEEEMKTTPSQYFDDYAALLRGNFNINGFFTKPSGIVIYYQQYDIAPYVRGIPEFFFPFQDCNPNA
ncbi:DUF3298 and DUF4163 domain-containing protein [Lacrimispora sp. BS-2]|uniref:DUF3298 and DUF4163 domain-containing protein n=1 Tax=Lacrimispora sp. BS-2 TaxID=3151850 RepID=A0AAU7PQN3_9FIRM